MKLHPWGATYLHQRNPWVPAWWSAAMPGLGHFCQGSYAKGFILMSLEIFLNHAAHLNLAIHYALTGRTALAQQVLDLKFALLYPSFYLLAIWDAYRLAVDSNTLFAKEVSQPRHRYQYHTLEVTGENALVKRSPGMALVMSVFTMGGGHFYNGQLVKAVMLLGWNLVIAIKAQFTTAALHTLLGRPDLASRSLDYQWALFWPSMFMFSVWNAYTDCVELNRLYDEAALYWIKKEYGPRHIAATKTE